MVTVEMKSVLFPWLNFNWDDVLSLTGLVDNCPVGCCTKDETGSILDCSSICPTGDETGSVLDGSVIC